MDPIERFKYPGPLADDGRTDDPGRKHFYMVKNDRVAAEIQVFQKGVRNKLHSHAAEDGVWIVLEGTATFYGEGDRVIAEVGKLEGVYIPYGNKYWFEGTSDEPLQIMRVDYKVAASASA